MQSIVKPHSRWEYTSWIIYQEYTLVASAITLFAPFFGRTFDLTTINNLALQNTRTRSMLLCTWVVQEKLDFIQSIWLQSQTSQNRILFLLWPTESYVQNVSVFTLKFISGGCASVFLSLFSVGSAVLEIGKIYQHNAIAAACWIWPKMHNLCAIAVPIRADMTCICILLNSHALETTFRPNNRPNISWTEHELPPRPPPKRFNCCVAINLCIRAWRTSSYVIYYTYVRTNVWVWSFGLSFSWSHGVQIYQIHALACYPYKHKSI